MKAKWGRDIESRNRGITITDHDDSIPEASKPRNREIRKYQRREPRCIL
jgi:hypothetical protein